MSVEHTNTTSTTTGSQTTLSGALANATSMSTILTSGALSSTTDAVAADSSGTGADSSDIAALIGGVVGGIVALLLLIGIIAFFVLRSRSRHSNQRNNDAGENDLDDAATMEVLPASSTRGGTSDYGPIGLPDTNTYHDIEDVRKKI